LLQRYNNFSKWRGGVQGIHPAHTILQSSQKNPAETCRMKFALFYGKLHFRFYRNADLLFHHFLDHLALLDYCASNISITIPETLLETSQKYIRKLEEENAELISQIITEHSISHITPFQFHRKMPHDGRFFRYCESACDGFSAVEYIFQRCGDDVNMVVGVGSAGDGEAQEV